MKLAVWTVAIGTVIVAGLFLLMATRSWESGAASFHYQEARDLTGFTDIVLDGDIELEITQGENFLVQVEATDDALAGLRALVEGTTLEIHRGTAADGFFGFFAPDFNVRVSLPQLTSLTVRGGAEADGINTFTGERLALVSSFGSEVDLAVDVSLISIEVSGGSDIDLTGAAGTAAINVSGGSDLVYQGIPATIEVSSSGGAEVSSR